MLATVQNSFDDYGISRVKHIHHRLSTQDRAAYDSEEFMVSLVQSLPFPIWIKDIHGRMRFISKAYQEIYGIKFEDYVRRFDHEVWPFDVAESFKKADDEVLNGREVKYTVEIVPSNKFSKERDHITVAKFPIFKGPEVIGIAGIVTSVFP